MKNDIENNVDIKQADIIVGIPSYNESDTIPYVVQQVDEGLQKYFGDKIGVIINVDNNSPDDTKTSFLNTKTTTPKMYISTPEGVKGKGNNFYNLFQKAQELQAKVVIVVDADLKSITPEWIRGLGNAILDGNDYVTPIYLRNEYDGTITNHLCYPVLYGLLGIDIRQPIGGDFACSSALISHYAEQDWTESMRQYGVDIFMTLSAIFGGFKLAQIHLGAKVHKPSAPKLDGMATQVVDTLFKLILANKDQWAGKKIAEVSVPKKLNEKPDANPQGLSLDYKAIKASALTTFADHYKTIEKELPEDVYETVKEMYFTKKTFDMDATLWSKIVYALLASYDKAEDSSAIIEAVKPLYMGRNVSFIKKTLELDFQESEDLIQAQAKVFWENREYALKEIK